MKNYGKLAVGLITGWFIFALSASALHLFKNDSNRVGVVVAMAALSPIVLCSIWCSTSKKFRQFVLSLSYWRLVASFRPYLPCPRATAT